MKNTWMVSVGRLLLISPLAFPQTSRSKNAAAIRLLAEVKNMLMRKRTLRVALLLWLLPLSVSAQNPAWEAMKTQNVLNFSFDCVEKAAFPKQALGKIVQQAMRGERGETCGDVSVAIKLQKQGPTVYFVPTVCDKSGNCTWLLFTINPVKSIGEIKGQEIYTYQSSQGMPLIVTVSSVETATDSATRVESISTYSYVPESGKYKSLGDDHRIEWDAASGRAGATIPTFLRKAKALMPQCGEEPPGDPCQEQRRKPRRKH